MGFSKYLTWLLRHSGIEKDEGGFVALDVIREMEEVLKRKYDTSLEEFQRIVAEDNKKRFKLEDRGEAGWWIRCNQGHSRGKAPSAEKLLRKVADPDEIPVCSHGTYTELRDKIVSGGLKRISREMIHCSATADFTDEVTSGIRQTCTMLVFIDVRKAMEAGMEFWISDNDVILTEGFDGAVPPEFFSEIKIREVAHVGDAVAVDPQTDALADSSEPKETDVCAGGDHGAG